MMMYESSIYVPVCCDIAAYRYIYGIRTGAIFFAFCSLFCRFVFV